MEKNCSRCKGFHTAPFGSRCKHIFQVCGSCQCRHPPPLGTLCTRVSELTYPITMAVRSDPVLSDFTDRTDPKYLQFLEDSYLKKGEDKSDISMIHRRLEALETRAVPGYPHPHYQPGPSKPVSALGLGVPAAAAGVLGDQVGIGARSKMPAGIVAAAEEDDDDPSPADAVIGPLTDVLQKLSIAVDPTNTSHKLKGMYWKPEYHVQHVKHGVQLKQIDHTKLNYRELVYGWFCILQHLKIAGGDVDAYLSHCKYVSSQAMLSQFTDSAYVGYDRHVTNQVIKQETSTFIAGDTLGVASHFHAGNVIHKKTFQKPVKQGNSSWWNKRQSED